LRAGIGYTRIGSLISMFSEVEPLDIAMHILCMAFVQWHKESLSLGYCFDSDI
jgi:hypothetical protein